MIYATTLQEIQRQEIVNNDMKHRETLVGEKSREYIIELILEWSTETIGLSCYGTCDRYHARV